MTKSKVMSCTIWLDLRSWNKVFDQKDCPYCEGTNKAPSSDNRTACGFCKDGL